MMASIEDVEGMERAWDELFLLCNQLEEDIRPLFVRMANAFLPFVEKVSSAYWEFDAEGIATMVGNFKAMSVNARKLIALKAEKAKQLETLSHTIEKLERETRNEGSD